MKEEQKDKNPKDMTEIELLKLQIEMMKESYRINQNLIFIEQELKERENGRESKVQDLKASSVSK